MAKPKVSILMATWNRARMIEKTFRSVQVQTFKNWELVIADDGSTDETPEIVKSLQRHETRIIYVRSDVNQGISKNYNMGFAKVSGEYIAMIDDDDPWCDNRKLEKQVAFLDAHPDYVGCGGGVIVVGPVRGGPPKGLSGARLSAGETSNGMGTEFKELYRYLKPETDEAIRKRMLFSNPMANSTTLFRRSAAEKVGWYDASIRYSGDRDFWLKMGLIGKLYNFPEYFSYYTVSGLNTSIAHMRPHLATSLAVMKRYKGKYPGYLPALILNEIQYAYSFLPAFLRKLVHTSLARLKRLVVG